MIIGRDVLLFLKIDLRFSDDIIKWDGTKMPFKHGEASPSGTCHIADDKLMEDTISRVKKILDDKYKKANLTEICQEQSELDDIQTDKLQALLKKHDTLFNGQLGRWHGLEANLELKEEAKPHHAHAYSIPQYHLQTLKMEAEHLS